MLRETLVALTAALLSETTHVLDPLLPSEVGVQTREANCGGAFTVIVNVAVCGGVPAVIMAAD